jgi:predicted Fe-S protein YdhL (DUF1289 family)
MQARRQNIRKAQEKWQNMSPEERSEAQPNSEAQQRARRQNIQKAQQKWQNMSPEARRKAMPGGEE